MYVRLIQQPAVVNEITDKQLLIEAESMVQAQKAIVGVICTQDATKVGLGRKIEISLESVDGIDVVEHGRVVKRRFAPPLQLVICVQESLVFLNRPANRSAKLVLPQSVCAG